MESGIFVAFIPIGGGMAFLAAVAFLIGAAQDAKQAGSKADVVKHVYFYLTAFITLLIVVFASVTLLNVGLKSWAFHKADDVANYRGTPPSFFLTSSTVQEKVQPTGLTCATETCTLTDADRQDLANWKQSYTDWKNQNDIQRMRATTTVVGLSFLIVGLAAFLFHWRVIQRERAKRTDGRPLVIRAIYLWSMALTGLLMLVISTGFLLNTVLRMWLYPNVDTTSNSRPIAIISEQASVDSIITCGEKCGISNEDVSLARQWKADYTAATSGPTDMRAATRQNELATTLPFVVVGIPLFAYHWIAVRKREDEPIATTQSPDRPEPPHA
jgi:hypothetical protein